MPRKSVILFGEGKTEAIFLNHLVQAYKANAPNIRITVRKGDGGSPKTLVHDLANKHLKIANYDQCLLLIDNDRPTSEIPKTDLSKYNIRLVCSTPRCLEGLCLAILGDLPKGAAHSTSKKLKKQFNKKHLGTDKGSECCERLRGKCKSLFPKSKLEKARKHIPELDEILRFLGV